MFSKKALYVSLSIAVAMFALLEMARTQAGPSDLLVEEDAVHAVQTAP